MNCSRENEQSSERESALASIVFPTPGKSSMIRWPSLTRQSTHRRSVSSGAWTTRREVVGHGAEHLGRGRDRDRLATGPFHHALQQALDLVEDLGRDLLLRRARDLALACLRDQHDLVVYGVEADVVTGHVVVDDEVDALVAQLPPRALEAVVAGLGREADEQLAVAAPRAQDGEDVEGRLERERPGGGVLRPLGVERARPGGSRRPRPPSPPGRRRRGPAPRGRRRRPRGAETTSTPSGAAPPGSPRRASRPRRGGPPPRRARRPSGRTSGCRGSAPASSGSRVPPAATTTRLPASAPVAGASSSRIRWAISRGSAIRPTPEPPSASSPSAGPTNSTPRERSSSAFACVAGCDHMRSFIAGATTSGPRCASAASVRTLSASPCASLAIVFAVSGAIT